MNILLELWLLAFSASIVSAFQDTSPFLLFSSSEILFPSTRFATASSISDSLSSALSECPSDVYVVVHQPGVKFADFSEMQPPPTIHLKEWMTGDSKKARSSAYIPEVVGNIEPRDLAKKLAKKCGAESLSIDASTGDFDTAFATSKKSYVVSVEFLSPHSTGKRSDALSTNDLFLANVLDAIPSSSKLTVLYTTTPPMAAEAEHLEKPSTYEMDDSMSPMHMDLKRDVSFEARQDAGNITLVDGPLFERYQYFTPGIFMGGLAMFFILSIGFVGVNALQSLQVSYAAFDKENGPAAQKKQQ